MKQSIRQQMRALRRKLSVERRAEAATRAVSVLAGRAAGAQWVLSYVPFDGEVDLTPLNKQLANEGKLVLPRMEGNELALYEVHDIEGVVAHPWGVWEPKPESPISYEQIDLVLVPGVAFTADGHRLGLGKGYYDRLLSQLSATTLGIAYREQQLPVLPTETGDVSLSEILFF